MELQTVPQCFSPKFVEYAFLAKHASRYYIYKNTTECTQLNVRVDIRVGVMGVKFTMTPGEFQIRYLGTNHQLQ